MPRSGHKYHVVLTVDGRAELEAITRMRSVGAARLRLARILLMSADGCTDLEISEEVGLCERQIVGIRQKFAKSGCSRRSREPRVRMQGFRKRSTVARKLKALPLPAVRHPRVAITGRCSCCARK